MSRMLRDETDDEPVAEFGARELHIDGEPYDNSASKFWSSLIDEIMLDFPDCDAFTLAAQDRVSCPKKYWIRSKLSSASWTIRPKLTFRKQSARQSRK